MAHNPITNPKKSVYAKVIVLLKIETDTTNDDSNVVSKVTSEMEYLFSYNEEGHRITDMEILDASLDVF